MWTLSCRHAPPHLQCIVNCCQVTMDKHRVSRPREQPLQTPFVSLRERQCPVFHLHNHPVPTSCHFMTAKSEESAAVHTNDPSTHLALQEQLSWFLFLSIAFVPKPQSALCHCLHSQNPARIESSLLCSYSTGNEGAS